MLLAQDTFHTNNFESFASSRKFLTEETLSTPMALSPLPYLPNDGGDVRGVPPALLIRLRLSRVRCKP
jgi:hypothetical protein